MSKAGTVPEQKPKDEIDEASTDQTIVKSTQELVDSMVALNASLGQPWQNPTKDRCGNFQMTSYHSGTWPSVQGDPKREPAFRQALQEVLRSLHVEKSQVSQAPKPRGEW